jgi:hypothetical protein
MLPNLINAFTDIDAGRNLAMQQKEIKTNSGIILYSFLTMTDSLHQQNIGQCILLEVHLM